MFKNLSKCYTLSWINTLDCKEYLMHFDIKLAMAEFIFLMNTILVFDSSSSSCQGTEPICNNVTYILVLWLLNPCICFFLNAHISPMCDPVPQCHFGDDGKQQILQEWFVAAKHPKVSKIQLWGLYADIELNETLVFYFCLEQDRLFPYVKADITFSFIFTIAKKSTFTKIKP